MLHVSILRALWEYGSWPSEYETFSAPVVTATAPRAFPMTIPIPSGSATASELRNAIQALLTLLWSKRVIVRQKAVLGL